MRFEPPAGAAGAWHPSRPRADVARATGSWSRPPRAPRRRWPTRPASWPRPGWRPGASTWPRAARRRPHRGHHRLATGSAPPGSWSGRRPPDQPAPPLSAPGRIEAPSAPPGRRGGAALVGGPRRRSGAVVGAARVVGGGWSWWVAARVVVGGGSGATGGRAREPGRGRPAGVPARTRAGPARSAGSWSWCGAARAGGRAGAARSAPAG